MTNLELLLRLRELGARLERTEFRDKDHGRLLRTRYKVTDCVFDVEAEVQEVPRVKKPK